MPAALTLIRTRTAPRFGIIARALSALALGRQRARLERLDDHLLRNIGLTRDEALAEALRPVWDVPSHRRG